MAKTVNVAEMSDRLNDLLAEVKNGYTLIVEQEGIPLAVLVSYDKFQSLQEDRIVASPARPSRRGWDEQFRAMAEQGDDRLLDGELFSLTQWDEKEWEW